MNFYNEHKLIEGHKLRCKVAINSSFKIGEEYKIDSIFHMTTLVKSFDMYINNQWFTLMLDDTISLFPLVNLYFFSEQEERKIKLQIIDLQSKIKI